VIVTESRLLWADRQKHTQRAAIGRVIVFLEPNCAPCRRFAPEVAAWRREVADRLRIDVVAASAEAAAALRAEIPELGDVLDDGQELSRRFAIRGTPSAVLVDDAGWSTRPAEGAEAIRALVEGGGHPEPLPVVARDPAVMPAYRNGVVLPETVA
jgi:hypothetical protein